MRSKKTKIYIAAILLVVAVALLVMTNKSTPEEVRQNNTGEAALSWDANKETNIAGYRIYYGTEKRKEACPTGGYGNVVDAGNATTYRMEGLAKDTTYYFSITSYNKEGKESCFSDEVGKIVR